jgi:DNA-binding NarL/FixJ family response regulator
MKIGDLKILIADDHNVVRTGIMRSLSDSFPGARFGEATNAAEILRLMNEDRWDLVILDINMPGRDGLDVLKELKEFHHDTPVIILSMYPEDQFGMRSIKAGASTYLTKETSSKELAEAIRKILSGGTYLTESMARIITDGLRNNNNNKAVHELLSDREYKVFLLIASGKSVSDIAMELSLSVKTISTYRSNILKKMALKNNSEITHYAFKFNLVE